MDDLVRPADWVGAHRRAVLTIVVVIVLILITIRLTLLQESGGAATQNLLQDLIDSLLSTVTVTALIATFFWWLRSPLSRLPASGEIFPDTIGRTLQVAAQDSDEWEYVGHTGRFVRAQILPRLEARSQAQGASIKVRFIIINPFNEDVCAAYAEYRTRSRSSSLSPQQWTKASVQEELLATIICLLRAKASHPDLEIWLGLAGQFGLWRFDKSDKEVVVTQEDPQQPAYRYLRGSRFFSYCRLECELAWSQAVQFHLAKSPHHGCLSDDEVLAALDQLFGRKMRALVPVARSALPTAAARISPYPPYA